METNEIKNLFRKGKVADAFRACERRASLNPNDPEPLKLLGSMHYVQGSLSKSIDCLKRALHLNPGDGELLFNLSVCMREMGSSSEAEIPLIEYTTRYPGDVNGWINRAEIELNLNKLEQCLTSCDRAISLRSNCVEAYNNRGNALVRLGEPVEALNSFQKALEYQPDFDLALLNQGSVLHQLGRYEEAIAGLQHLIKLRPGFAEAWSAQGSALSKLGRYKEALSCHEQAVKLNPGLAEAWSNRGTALNDLRRHNEAVLSHERAIKIKSNFPEAWVNRGNSLSDLGRFKDALASFDQAIKIESHMSEAWSNRGNALNSLGLYQDALSSYEKALNLKPDLNNVLGDLVHTQMKICHWKDLERRCQTIEGQIFAGNCNVPPFVALGLFDDPKIQKQCAENFIQDIPYSEKNLAPIGHRGRKERIRVGYFSMDFNEHPVSYLISGLIDGHDRSKFEVYGFSFGKGSTDMAYEGLKKSFDKFFQVDHLSELEIAELARSKEIDIAVDLGGHTLHSRPSIFLYRAAPIQVNYLGYPGTWGHSCMDYFIGDGFTITKENISHFSEKIIFMPNQFQANPTSRPSPGTPGKRSDFGLPESGFVFCCFNNNWKITPKTFQIWMRILQRVPNSVLWLYAENTLVPQNLRNEAENLGVKKDQLVFAERVSREKYMAQYHFADLFLDTLPYNAGTTASDALWACVPVLTMPGTSFAGRMAQSLLTAAGVPDLVAKSPKEYEDLAVTIAKNPQRLTELKSRLTSGRASAVLFDTPRFVRDLEAGFSTVYDRHCNCLIPAHVHL